MLKSGGLPKNFWKKCRKFFIKHFADPPCSMKIHGKTLQMPLSHTLPEFLAVHPFYDKLPGRLSDFIFNRYKIVTCVDVGANIGDSIAAFHKHENDSFLAIEPNPTFYRYLKKNWGNRSTITILDYVCSSSSKSEKFNIKKNHPGTASITSDEDGMPLHQKPLDDIINENLNFSNVNILKIDTDGHDCEVVFGAKGIISQNLPAILLECDAFSNISYVDDYMSMLKSLHEAGYSSFLLYDNVGHLIGKYSLERLRHFRDLLFYQLTKESYYYDILLMKNEDVDAFVISERSFFIDKLANQTLRRTAEFAAERCH